MTSRAELDEAAQGRTVVVQAAVDGPLLMCQSIFDDGTLVAFHANERTAEGAGGGASHKRSVSVPAVRQLFDELGSQLRWHGALSADVILTETGPQFIDINPRLIEPQNAYASGVDLVGPMLELATGGHPTPEPDGKTDVRTHQLLLAVLGAAQHGRGRRAILAELIRAVRQTHDYRGSTEELTPIAGDPRTVIPVAMAATATLLRPAAWPWFTSGSVSNYALTPQGWEQILDSRPDALIPPSAHPLAADPGPSPS